MVHDICPKNTFPPFLCVGTESGGVAPLQILLRLGYITYESVTCV